MILSWLILIPLCGGVLTGLLGRWEHGVRGRRAIRWIALGAALLDLVLAAAIWLGRGAGAGVGGGGKGMAGLAQASGSWLIEQDFAWIPSLGIRYHLGLDGMSLLLVALTGFIGVIAVLVSWREITRRVGLFHSALLFVLAGINGVFLALDLVLFYVFWEVMLVPMYFVIGAWGHERRIYAAIKFFLFTLASGLLMLVAILGLHYFHGRATGVYTFDYSALIGTVLPVGTERWLMLGFLAAFLVKLPAVPLHNWLPDAHSEAPTAGSVILAALLLKTGAYGLLRFILPLFPRAAAEFAPVAMLLGVIGILYGAMLAFAQRDLKRLVAYTSVSHMGFVLLGAFAGNELALQGTVMQMICHGISTGALFVIAGMLYERTGTRDLGRMGGFWARMPRMGGMAMVFVLASLGLPGLGNFVGEILILIGAYRANAVLAAIAAAGVVGATIYSLSLMQRVFLGAPVGGGGEVMAGRRDSSSTGAGLAGLGAALPDLTAREILVLAVLAIAIVWLGLFPQPVLNAAAPAISAIGRLFAAI